MRSIILPSALAAMAMLAASCGSSSQDSRAESGNAASKALIDAPVVAQKVPLGNDSIIVAKISSMPETVTIPASDILDDLKLVKLENKDEAIVGSGMVWVTDNRIFIYSQGEVKQFDHTGKYLGKVGARGQGPGEYSIAPYFITADENADKIYLMQYSASNISVYDDNGIFIENIPLAQKAEKGFFNVDNENGLVTVGALQFSINEEATPVWVQDMKGNMLSNVGRGDLTVKPDFSNEIMMGSTSSGDGFSYSLFRINAEADSLYEYTNGNFTPVFTYDFGGEVPMHDFKAFPKFFVVTTYGEPVETDESSYIVPANKPFIIDRATLKGGPAELMLDNFGTIIMPRGWDQCQSPGYFAWNVDPGNLINILEKTPESHPLATKEGLKKMQELKESIDPDDNNYVFIGRWKK